MKQNIANQLGDLKYCDVCAKYLSSCCFRLYAKKYVHC